ncbi:MAG TPA: hypothetical protein VFT99_12980, partial [Roseiflexaceae bacterium]|nr:hypothetical protein [Roseiflexaceae bacterium]
MLLPGFLGAPALDTTSRIQPALATLIASRPDSRVRIVVQERTSSSHLKDRVHQLGGIVTADLSIINGFAAEIPAQAVQTLAAAASVRWISLDANMNESSTT